MHETALLVKTNSYPEHTLIFILMAGFLAVDALVGVIEIYFGTHIKASLLYKTPVLMLILVILSTRALRFCSWVLAGILLTLVGPMVQLVLFSDINAFAADFVLILKIFSPVIYFKYFTVVVDEMPDEYARIGPILLMINFLVLLVNLILGAAGFGYASYSTGGTNIGINGFFGAGNELGAVFVVLTAYLLSRAYTKGFWTYTLVALFSITLGVMISTKTSILAALALTALMPVFLEGRAFFYPTAKKILVTTVLLLVLVTSVVLFKGILEQAGLWKRLVWLYEEYGLLRVVLSGRDQFAAELLAVFQQSSVFTWLFGLGSANLYNLWLPIKPFAELDPIDVLIHFGLIGLCIAVTIYLYLFKSVLSHWKRTRNSTTSAAGLAFFILIGLSFTSGHIWFSGMLGPFLGILLGLSYLEASKSKPRPAVRV